MSYRIITATSMFNAQSHITLVIYRWGVGELVGLEMNQGSGFATTILKLAHDFFLHGTSAEQARTQMSEHMDVMGSHWELGERRKPSFIMLMARSPLIIYTSAIRRRKESKSRPIEILDGLMSTVIAIIVLLPLRVDEFLLWPPESVLDGAFGNLHSINVLIIDADNQSERIANLDVLGHATINGFAVVNPHRGRGHGRSGRQWRGSQSTRKRKCLRA